MPKKTSDGVLTIAQPTDGKGAPQGEGTPQGEGMPEGEGMPPVLSEKFIARLQAAVEAAQRRQVPPPRFTMVREDESCTNQ